MIYCFGLKAKYDQALESGRPFYKYGRGIHDMSFQPGGAVFRTKEDAEAFLRERGQLGTRDVYGVLADWDTETAEFDGEPFRRLAKKAALIVAPE